MEGAVAGRRGHRDIPSHINFWIAARAVDSRLSTPMRFPDEAAANKNDTMLNMIELQVRRRTFDRASYTRRTTQIS
jgi:protocatechuate 3,4-dioxygenase, alpha subunit